MMTIPELITRAMAYDHGDARRIQHFLKVYTYADIIGQLEGLAPQELERCALPLSSTISAFMKPKKNTVARQGNIRNQKGLPSPGPYWKNSTAPDP